MDNPDVNRYKIGTNDDDALIVIEKDGVPVDFCNFFILDTKVDPHAISAIRRYIEVCKLTQPAVAEVVENRYVSENIYRYFVLSVKTDPFSIAALAHYNREKINTLHRMREVLNDRVRRIHFANYMLSNEKIIVSKEDMDKLDDWIGSDEESKILMDASATEHDTKIWRGWARWKSGEGAI